MKSNEQSEASVSQKNEYVRRGWETEVLTRRSGRSSEAAEETLSQLSSHQGVADLICLSHLRWDFVYQRPQHLMNRFARQCRVFYVEEPIFDSAVPRLEVSRRPSGVWVVVPHLPRGLSEAEVNAAEQSLLIDDLLMEYDISDYVLWYYTPMALGFTQHLEPLAVVYDCMDELSAFKGAPRALKEREAELFQRADLVFTGGYSLYEAKRSLHRNVYPFPSSIETAHFAQAREWKKEPADQFDIPHPRLGFFGVIDERLDIELLAGMADARPDWHFVMVGPVVKIDPTSLPRRRNIHYLGSKTYQELPAYVAGWDVALLTFAQNEATRFISPTKTPEYLAAGRPVISTPIRDVVRPYGQQNLVKIAANAAEFVAAAEELLSDKFDRAAWLRRVDAFLSQMSWDQTWQRMSQLIESVASARQATEEASEEVGDEAATPLAAAPRTVNLRAYSPVTAD
jgi:glycosyltransferase involved in cell wall biosynthesis